MEDKKCYVPEIEEFCVGFEYEYKQSKDIDLWAKMSFSFDVLRFDLESPLKNEVRVKYLDEQDIIDLEFKYTNNDRDLVKDDFRIRTYIGDSFKVPNIKVYFKENIVFSGEIKNKTELIKLLKQISIE